MYDLKNLTADILELKKFYYNLNGMYQALIETIIN